MEKRELKFLGRGSCFNVKEGNTAAYMEDPTGNGDLLLIDCGGTVFSKIVETGILEGKKRIFIIITHTHADHVGSLADLIFYCYYVMGIKVYIYTEYNHILSDLLNINGVSYVLYDFFHMEDDLSFFSIECVLQEDHYVNCDTSSCSFIIKIPCLDEIIFYSGDTSNAESLAYLEDADYIYYDCAVRDSIGGSKYPHVNIFELRNKFEYFGIPLDRLRLMHIDCDWIFELAEDFGIKVVEVE